MSQTNTTNPTTNTHATRQLQSLDRQAAALTRLYDAGELPRATYSAAIRRLTDRAAGILERGEGGRR